MPNPLEVLLDPISLGIIAIFIIMLCCEAIFPARKLTQVKSWYLQCILGFWLYFYLASYLPMLWDQYLTPLQIIDLSQLPTAMVLLIAVLAFEFFIYVWHRLMHTNHRLWLIFHQMHHSAERVDAWGAYFFSPLDMIGFTFIGSFSLSFLFGIEPQVITWFLFITTFLAIFQHTNIKTPQWLGFIIQRPESHSIHHQRGIHKYNYSDLPVFDIIFGTFKNPKDFADQSGFYSGSSKQIINMLQFKDVYKKSPDK